MEIRELQAHAQELRTQQGWQHTSLERRLAFLLSEMGEVAQEVEPCLCERVLSRGVGEA